MKLLAADSFEPIFEPLLGRRVGYVPTTGGVGDLLVEMAALQLFAHFGVDYHVETLGGDCEADVLVLAGGGPGPLCPPSLAARLAEIATEIPVTLLPRSLTAPVGVPLRRCHVRDRASLDHAPDGIVMPDLVLGLEVTSAHEPDDPQGVWLRCDDEGLFAGHGLGDPDLVCGTAVEYLALAARHRAILTDRPEFALAALVQGRETTLLPSASAVNRSLFDTWLADLGCRWLDAGDATAAGSAAAARLAGATAPGLPAAWTAPRRIERAVARCDAGLRQIEARFAGRERIQQEAIAALVAAQDRLLRRIDDLQESIYALRADAVLRPTAAAGDAAAPEHDRQREYTHLVSRIRGAIRDLVPAEARVLVVSRGDDELLRLFGRRAGHFPQAPSGVYAGHHPPDAAAAVAHLETLRAAGWDHLLVPATALWWLDHYAGFAGYLQRSAALVHRDADCAIYALGEASPWAALADFVARFKESEERYPAILDWGTGSGLAAVFPESAVFTPPDEAARELPYVEESIDVIAIPCGDPTRLAEARRVAIAAVVEVPTAESGPTAVLMHPLGRHAAPRPAAVRMNAARPALEAGRRLP